MSATRRFIELSFGFMLLSTACGDAPPTSGPSSDAGAADVGASSMDVAGDVSSDTIGSGGDGAPGEGGVACVDLDLDGYPSTECGGMAADCDDGNDRVHPGRSEVCDRMDLDEDCNPCTVAGATDGDGDNDTFLSATCANTYRGAAPVCPSGVRTRGVRVVGTDCDDLDGNVRPNVPEVCNGRDDNCNDMVDEGLEPVRYYRDVDGDTFGNPAMPLESCAPPSGYVTNDRDCDDLQVTIAPGATELCNGRDDNCNDMVDDLASAACPARANAASTCASGACTFTCISGYADCDGNPNNGCEVNTGSDPDHCGACPMVCPTAAGGSRACVSGACSQGCPSGYINCGSSCFDARTACTTGVGACSNTGSWVCRGSTAACNAVARTPGTEICDGIDNDCDGSTDEDLTGTCYEGPANTAGRGVCRSGTRTCAGGRASACVGQVLPAPAGETCNGMDDDCDGVTDEGTQVRCFADADADGYALASAVARMVCPSGASCPTGYTARVPNSVDRSSFDCNDSASGGRSINPGVLETCNGVDDNCDGAVDEGASNRCTLASRAASMVCAGAACTVGTCQANYGDCDGSSANGCETYVTDNFNNCGRCGNRCATGQYCGGATCRSGCPADLPNTCSGVCVDLTSDNRNCGACGRTCTTTRECVNRVCVLRQP